MVDLREVVIERFDRLEDRRTDWHRLASVASHPFAAPEWLGPWWATHGAGSTLLAFASRRTAHDDPFALLLLSRDEHGTVRFLGDGMSDLVGPVCAPADTADAVAALGLILDAELAVGDRFVATALPRPTADAVIDRLPGSHEHALVSCPSVRIDGTSWEAYLDGRAHRRRRRLATQAERLLARDHVHITEAGTSADIVDAFAVLLDLHQRRFGSRSRSFVPPRDAFVAAALANLAEIGRATIRVLHVDESPAAAIIVLHDAGDDWFYQGGWDPAFADLSVGRTLLADTIRTAFERERGSFHLLRGAEEYKDHWANDDRPVVTVEARWSA